MGLLRRLRSGRIIALDIGSAALKLLVMERQASGALSVVDFRLIQVGAGGKLGNVNDLAVVVGPIMREVGAGKASVRAAICGRHAVIRVIEMPKVPAEEVKRAVAFQLGRYVPIPAEEVVYDCQLLAGLRAREGMQRVLLVALRRSVVEQHTRALREAGVEPMLLDVEPLASFNALAALGADFDRYAGIPHLGEGDVCIVHFGVVHTDLCAVRDGMPLACRALEIGEMELMRDVGTTLHLEAGEALKEMESGMSGKGGVAGCYERYGQRVAAEIKSSFEYLRREAEYGCARVYLSGGLADRPGVAELMTRLLGVPALRFDPLVNVNLEQLENRVGALREQAATFVPAVGLGVRRLAVE
ncbi:MAG: pilus assembly protein PilM [bacterium]|nr:pilus assembly protein PilM [bacterium]